MQTPSIDANLQDLSPEHAACLRRVEECSPFLSRCLSQNSQLRLDLLSNLHISCGIAEMQHFLAQREINDENSLKKALRKLRMWVLGRIITRDLTGLADLQEVMLTTSLLAELTINTAVNMHQTWLEPTLGMALTISGEPQSLIVVGMGKLGGRELNVSSDVDLIFAYEQDGQTANGTSCQEYFVKLGKKVIAALDDITEDGFVFRVDMRLRPFGGEGALASSLDALEDYYQNNGREWERYAWIKGRVVVGPNEALSRLLKPFVYRKYLDFNAYAAMRDLKLQIHRDVTQRGLHENIKLGRGGIREIEFIAQVFQLIRGGRDASLQIIPTLEVLQLLQQKGLLPELAVAELSAAYVFLRNLEHRLMYVEDQQTQDLPKHAEAQLRIAKSMSFADWETFYRMLNEHRGKVQAHFDAVFAESATDQHEAETKLWQGLWADEEAKQALHYLNYHDTAQSLHHLKSLRASQRYLQLPEQSRQRLDKLMPLMIREASTQAPQMHITPDVALLRGINLIEAICRRASYLAMLAEYPNALSLVIKLLAASPWLASYLSQHPILLDELLSSQTLYSSPDFAAMKHQLREKMQVLQGDTEAQMDAMRHFKHSHILRFAAQDVTGQLVLETLSDYLSALADLILEVSIETIWQGLRFIHREIPQFAVIGYGKLGGRELGYMSDLDIIFLYQDAHDSAGEIYGRFAQRINNWFNSSTNAGLLYETDLQLRPDGNSGLLVSSVEAFRDYQLNRAWVWEHQAITRARFVAGNVAIGEAFEAIRKEVLQQPREIETLKIDVVNMRKKMRETHHDAAGMFDIKQSEGGIIDVEFIVQFLVLAHANSHPSLTQNSGNIALMHLLAELGMIDVKLANSGANAYRHYRQLLHAAKLQTAETKVPLASVASHQASVKALWQAVFGA